MVAAVESMMFSGAVPWHGLGHYVGDVPVPWQEAILKAGLDWTVSMQPLYADAGVDGFMPINNWKRVCRDSDNKTLGIVSSRYTPVQNEEAFLFLDDLVLDGNLRYETAGSLRSGKTVFMLAVTKREMFIGGEDQIIPYLLLTNTHDGTGRLTVALVYVRVVCMNTLTASLADQRSKQFGIKHIGLAESGGVQAHAKEARDVLGLAHDQMDTFERLANRLTQVKVTDAMVEEYLYTLVPDPVDPEVSITRAKNARGAIMDAINTFPGSEMATATGTAWGMLQGATAFSTHIKTTRGGEEGRLTSTLYGSSATFAQRAWNKAITLAEVSA